ncbi:MAG TPA: methylated-DNA--[protein]-cysteine S-methyltransferase [Opitutus sp.]|nr:methylated-DNA--[protein]-cysteine S-methyltransferase [Opitutus sp.]
MNLHIETFPTPAGDFTIAVDSAGAVIATAFGPAARLPAFAANCHTLYDNRRTARVREQILAYFAGERRDFDLPLAPAGSAFQQRVWSALREIPFGETRSYGDLARALDSSPRAIGRANATNPICLIVPCHRVIGADGSLTGYAFGEDIKRRLLEHEGALQPALT